MYTVFAHSVYCSYRAPIFSKATAFYILATAVTFIAPLLVTYRSQGFWLRQSIYLEQPDIHFEHRMIVELETNEGKMVGWSTFQGYNSFLAEAEAYRVPMLKTSEIDFDRDGKKDELNLKLDMPLFTGETVMSARLYLFFDVRLYRFSSVHLSGMALVESSQCGTSPMSVRFGFSAVGDLMLVQKQPIAPAGRDERFLESIVKLDGIFADDFDLPRIIRDYQARNVTTRLDNSYLTWTNGASATPDTFTAEVTIRYPEQSITYRPGFWQMMKWGWVQYVSVLIVFIFVFRHIKTYVFSKQVLPTQPCLAKVKTY